MRREKKTILHLIETGGPGGAEKVMIDLASGLNERLFRSIVCLRKDGWLYDQFRARGIESYLLQEKGIFDVGFLFRLIMLVLTRDVAIIHAHEFLMSVYGSIVAFFTNIPIVCTIHGKYYYWEKERRRLALRLCSRTGQMVAVSNELKVFLSQKLEINPRKIRTIYNGIDLRQYSRVSNYRLEKMRQLGLDDKHLVIGTVGNLYPIKGQKYLIQAIPKIIRECPHSIFLFIGRGDEEKNLRREAIDLGVSDHVRFLGFRSDVPELLNVMDIFVLPSLGECLPLALLEAMAMGLPLVVTSVGGNSEIVEDGKSGYLVPASDSRALAEKVILLSKNKKRAKAMGSRGREAIWEKFSLQAMLANYESLYCTLFGATISP